MTQKKTVLVCPLNWGLGHATRMVPIIELLIEKQFNVIIASSGNALEFLKREFSDLKYIDFPSYKVTYSRSNSQAIKMFVLFPVIVYWSIKEHFKLKKIIRYHHIDIIISDNRFGLWNKHIYSIFITHQLKLSIPKKLKFLESVYLNLINWIVGKYNECWIPDLEGENNLAGELAHTRLNLDHLFYIGPLSRYWNKHIANSSTKKFDVLFILSGPEPQRTIFEDIIISQAQNSKLKIALVRGTLSVKQKEFSFPIYDILNTNELKGLIDDSELVISRSGYSSIMDLIILGKKAVLVPTPGQTEQEYLANYLMRKQVYYFMNQKTFDLEKAINNAFTKPLEILFSKESECLVNRIERLKE